MSYSEQRWKTESKQSLQKLKKPGKDFLKSFKTMDPFKMFGKIFYFILFGLWVLVQISFYSFRLIINK